MTDYFDVVNDDKISAFLADTLVLWRVSGTVETGEAPVVAVIRAAEGTVVTIERPAEGMPFRWIVRSGRARPCASIVGLLNAVRGALGVEHGSAVRIAASAPTE